MAKLSAFPSLPTVDRLDVRHQLDTSDLTDGPGGSNKGQTFAEEQDQGDLWRFPANVAALPALGPAHTDGDVVTIKGHTTQGDGGDGPWRLDTSSVLTPDNGSVVAATGGGNWLRLIEGKAKPEMWGAKADGATDDSTAIQSALDSPHDVGFVDGKTYNASGLDLTVDGKTIDGHATLALIDSSTDAQLLLISADKCTVSRLTLKGNTANPPSFSGAFGSPIRVTGNDNVIVECKFLDATNTGSAEPTVADNIILQGNRNIVRDCRSDNAAYSLYSVHDGDNSQFVNCFGRRGASTNRAFNGTVAGSPATINSLLIDGMDVDGLLRISWGSPNKGEIIQNVTINNTQVITTGDAAGKFGHIRNLSISNSYFESTVDSGIRLVDWIGTFNISKSTVIADDLFTAIVRNPSSATGRTMRTFSVDGCTIGNDKKTPSTGTTYAMRTRAFHTTIRDSEINNFTGSGILPWPDIAGGVEEINLNTPPVSPATGEVWVVGGVPTGAWSSNARDLAEWTGSAWEFVTPHFGFVTYDKDTGDFYEFVDSSTDWTALSLEDYSLHIENSNFIGGDAGTLSMLGDGTADSEVFEFQDSLQYRFFGNTIRNVGAGGTAIASTGSMSFMLDQRAPRAWQGTAAPTLMFWNRGDVVINSAPAVGNPQGFVCTVSGTPGTWVNMPNL